MEQTGVEPVSLEFQSSACTSYAAVPSWVFLRIKPIVQGSKPWVLPIHHRAFCTGGETRTLNKPESKSGAYA